MLLNSFLVQDSHYSRKDNLGKKFLEEDLSVRRRYKKYLQEEEPKVWERKEDILR